jgi:hypothetical protein
MLDDETHCNQVTVDLLVIAPPACGKTSYVKGRPYLRGLTLVDYDDISRPGDAALKDRRPEADQLSRKRVYLTTRLRRLPAPRCALFASDVTLLLLAQSVDWPGVAPAVRVLWFPGISTVMERLDHRMVTQPSHGWRDRSRTLQYARRLEEEGLPFQSGDQDPVLGCVWFKEAELSTPFLVSLLSRLS